MQISKVVEWKPIYIDFDFMDAMLQPFVTLNLFTSAKMKSMNKNPSFAYTSMIIEDANCTHELERLNEKFVEKLCRDMSKCDKFYSLHLAQVEIKLRKLTYNIFIYMDLQQNDNIKNQRYILKQYCEMLYLECSLLDQFSIQNQLVVKKLLRKYRKQVWFSETNDGLSKMTVQFNHLKIFNNREELSKIQIRLKLLYTRYLTHKTCGSMKYLKYHNIYKGFSSKEQLLIGVYLGLSFCFLLYIISRRYQLNKNFYKNEFYYDLYFPMFRGIGLMILYYWSLIFCVYCWLKGNVGYRQILNFKYHCSSVNQLVKRAAGLTLIYLIVLIISLSKELYLEEEKDQYQYLIDYVTKNLPYDPAVGPLLLWIFMLLYMCAPTKKYLNAKGRKYFWKIIFTSLLSGFYECPFVNGWATDQLLSLAVMLKDFAYTACFYYEYFKDFDNTQKQAECGDPKNLEIGLIVCLIPIFLRFVQIGRCLHDAKKVTVDDICVIIIYIEVLLVNVFSYLTQFGNIYLYFWIASFCALACNAYFWDVKKDWGLFQKGQYLRKLLAFSPIYYYCAIAGEFFLRFAWVLSISPNMASSIHLWSPLFTLLMAILELCRRTLWNIFRIENVHIQNMGDFKAVQPIQLPFENLIDQESYNNLKELKKNQVEPINISLLSGGQSSNSVAGQYYRTSLKSQSVQDQDSLNELQKQEQDLFSENLFEDRQRESILINRYSQFKEEHHNEKDENLNKQQLIKDLNQINDLIKKMN